MGKYMIQKIELLQIQINNAIAQNNESVYNIAVKLLKETGYTGFIAPFKNEVYNIDYNRCIFCGYCVEACPTDAITHGHGFEIASFNVSNLVYRKEQTLAPVPAHMGANSEFSAGDMPKLGKR